MNTDDLTQRLHASFDAEPLDPGVVLQAAKARQRRIRLMAGLSGLAAVAVAAAVFFVPTVTSAGTPAGVPAAPASTTEATTSTPTSTPTTIETSVLPSLPVSTLSTDPSSARPTTVPPVPVSSKAATSKAPTSAKATVASARAATLADLQGTWRATSASPVALVRGSSVQLTFSGSALTVQTGCNAVASQSVSVSSGVLAVGELTGTLMGCTDSLDIQEAQIRSILGSQPSVRIAGTTLTVTSSMGTLILTR